MELIAELEAVDGRVERGFHLRDGLVPGRQVFIATSIRIQRKISGRRYPKLPEGLGRTCKLHPAQ